MKDRVIKYIVTENMLFICRADLREVLQESLRDLQDLLSKGEPTIHD